MSEENAEKKENDITLDFRKVEDLSINDIRNVGKKVNNFLKATKFEEKFKGQENLLVFDLINFASEAFLENDEVFEAFSEVFKEATGKDFKELKGSDLKIAIEHTFDFIKEINLSGFFSQMTTLFMSMIKG